ncbi:MAG: phosphatidylglycerol lysyltransferase domain-containing protein [Desulfuromonadales bacterium]
MMIPNHPSSKPLDISDKPELDRLFAELQPQVSELTFANLYLFRKAHDYQLGRIGGSLIVTGCGYDGNRYCLPPLGGDMKEALTALSNDKMTIYGADESLAQHCRDTHIADCTEDRDSFDYLYLREELATLPGNRFHKKKNRIHYFTLRHSYHTEIYSPDIHQAACLSLLETWRRMSRLEQNRSLDLELEATVEALAQAPLLSLEGIVAISGETVVAFALGERLNSETAVCHFEKADPFLEGASQLINREFAACLFNDCRYLNREQDLGEAGLRSAKLSYHPVELIKKYRVRLS